MQSFSPLSQYFCSKCDAILKETDAQIEISTVIEDCPNCGASLTNTLTRRSNVIVEPKPSLAKFQTAYDLTRFKFDIEKISKFMPLSSTGSLCITGYKANLVLARLCVRSLLPANYGGLGSPYAIVIDAGNKSDFYQTVSYIRQYGMHLTSTLDRIIVSRTFTIYQLKSLLLRELPKVIQQYRPSVVIVPGLLDLFDDPNIKKKEAKRVIERVMKLINAISDRLLVITSISDIKYASLVMPSFDKRVMLSKTMRNRVNADLYNDGRKANVVLTEKELALVRCA